MAGALQDEGFQRTARKLDPDTRSPLTAFLKLALPRLVRIRRPRNLRRPEAPGAGPATTVP